MTAEELLRFATELRRGNKAFLSNAYFTLPQLEAFLAKPGVTVRCSADLAVIFEEDDGLLRVYLYARNDDALGDLAALLPPTSKPVITDLLGREPAAAQLSDRLRAHGFAPHSILVRMICTEPTLPRAQGVEAVTRACPADAAEIRRLLLAEFDPLFAHFPNEADLADAAEKGEITVIRQEGEIAGLAYFEKVAEKYCVLRYFVVQNQYRGRNIGGALLYHTFSQAAPGMVYMLWTESDNKTQDLYLRLGFRHDGVRDHILEFGGEYGKDL